MREVARQRSRRVGPEGEQRGRMEIEKEQAEERDREAEERHVETQRKYRGGNKKSVDAPVTCKMQRLDEKCWRSGERC